MLIGRTDIAAYRFKGRAEGGRRAREKGRKGGRKEGRTGNVRLSEEMKVDSRPLGAQFSPLSLISLGPIKENCNILSLQIIDTLVLPG